jgi:hypothetical protein
MALTTPKFLTNIIGKLAFNIVSTFKHIAGFGIESLGKVFSSVGATTLGTKLIASGGAFKTISLAFGKFLMKNLKFIPVIGALVSAYSAYTRFKKGDIVGGVIDMASGIASFVPGLGTAISVGLGLVNAGRDLMGSSDKKEEIKPDKSITTKDLGLKAKQSVLTTNKKSNGSEESQVLNTTLEEPEQQQTDTTEEVQRSEETDIPTEVSAVGEAEVTQQTFQREREIVSKSEASEQTDKKLQETNRKLDRIVDAFEKQLDDKLKEQSTNVVSRTTNSSNNTINYINNTARDLAYFERNVLRGKILDERYAY